MKRRETGILGEKIAINFLRKRGYRILETNYRCHYGEIDIVARQKDCLAFIEVRTKKSLVFDSPEESITRTKKEHMRATANHYLQTHGNVSPSWRIDMVAIELNQADKPLRVELIEYAVEEG